MVNMIICAPRHRFHGTLELGELFQTQEALRHAVHWSKEGMERHKAGGLEGRHRGVFMRFATVLNCFGCSFMSC